MRRGQGEGTGILPRELRFAAKWLYELCFWFSMPDETVATRPPWLDSSLPRLPCQCISGFLGHNSTVSKQLRYSLTREYICQPFVENEAPSYCQQKRKQPPSSRPKIASSNLHFTTILTHKPFFYSFLIKIHTFSYIFY